MADVQDKKPSDPVLTADDEMRAAIGQLVSQVSREQDRAQAREGVIDRLHEELRADGPAGDVSQVTDELLRAASALLSDTAEAGELLAMRAALLAAASAAEPGQAGLGPPVTDALSEAVARLPVGHPVRTAEFGLLRQALGSQVTSARAADDPVARLEDIVAALDRMPNDQARGDVDRAAALGLTGLQELVGDVLMQDTDENALHRARQGTNEAMEKARQSVSRYRVSG